MSERETTKDAPGARPRRSATYTLCYACLLAAAWLFPSGCAHKAEVAPERANEALTVRRPALYPETIAYDGARSRFLLGSLREGAIYAVDAQGAVSPVVNDPRLCSVLGIAIDAQRGRLWAVNADLGASLKPSGVGPKQLAAVGVYDLATGAPLQYVELAQLAPGAHLVNGIALDQDGNAYISDSFSPVIYKVDVQGSAELWLEDARFRGDGINLNGLVVHPDGYLLVVKKSDGSLFRVPLAQPSQLTQVALDRALVGGDGLLLSARDKLVVIANKTPSAASNAAFWLSSDDGFASARVSAVEPLGDVYPTTGVLRDGALYVLHSKLDELIQAPPAQKAELRMEATIRLLPAPL